MLKQLIRFVKLFLLALAILAAVFGAGWFGRDLIVSNASPSPVAETPALVTPEETRISETKTEAEPSVPVVSEPETVVPAPAVQIETPATPPKPAEAFTPGEAHVGNLHFKARSAAVKYMDVDNGGSVTLSGTLSFLIQNTSDQPISIAATDPRMPIQYDDGTVLHYGTGSRTHLSGLSLCNDEPSRCASRKPSPFTQIEPNSSPVSVSLVVDGYVTAPSVKSLALIKTGTLSTKLLVMEGDVVKNITVSLTDFPVTNNVPKE